VFTLDSDVVSNDVDRMWRSLVKLVRSMKTASPAVLRVAETALNKVRLHARAATGVALREPHTSLRCDRSRASRSTWCCCKSRAIAA
jgi:hypothetical protein